MIKIKIDQKHSVQLPSTPEEITLDIFLKLLDNTEKDPIRDFSILTGISIDEVKKMQNVSVYLDVLKRFAVLTSEINEVVYKGGEEIKIGDKVFNVPSDIASKRVDLYEYGSLLLRQNDEHFLKNDTKKILECYSAILAHYFQSSLSNYQDYDAEQAYYMKETVRGCAVKDVIGFGNFFFVKLLELVNGTNPGLEQKLTVWQKLNPGSWMSRKRGGFWARFGKSRNTTH